MFLLYTAIRKLYLEESNFFKLDSEIHVHILDTFKSCSVTDFLIPFPVRTQNNTIKICCDLLHIHTEFRGQNTWYEGDYQTKSELPIYQTQVLSFLEV